MARLRKSTFRLDNASGSITAYTDDINSVELQVSAEILEDTGLNSDDVSIVSGIKNFQVSINGYTNSGTAATNIIEVLRASVGTSTTKTFEYKVGSYYYTGEVLPENLNLPNDGKALTVWSCTLRGDGALTKTSVAVT